MARAENQKLKILYLMQIMLQKTDELHGISTAQIIQELAKAGIEAERKSVYRDIALLKEYGMDIVCQKGKTVTYFLASRTFELPELKLLVDAVQSSKFITAKKSEQLIKKLETFLSVWQASSLSRQVVVANRIKNMNESIYYTVDTIHEAIAQDKQITFQYFEWQISTQSGQTVSRHLKKGGARYQVSPWALIWEDENYYMAAYDESACMLKHYRVDKMLNIAVLPLARVGQDVFGKLDLATYSQGIFGMFGGKPERVTLQFHNRLVGVVIERFGENTFIHRQGEEHFVVHVPVVVSDQFFSWVFSFGKNAKILAPREVQQRFLQHCAAVAEQYKGDEDGTKEDSAHQCVGQKSR